jgi:DNA-directed RNA polymerase
MPTQKELNREMLSSAKLTAQKIRAASIAREDELISKPVRRLLSGSVERVARGIDSWVAKAGKTPGVNHSAVPYLRLLPSDVVAVLASKVILSSVSSHKPMTALCVKIGEAVEDEIRMRGFKRAKGGLAVAALRRLNKTKKGYDFRRKCARQTQNANDVKIDLWTRKQRLHVGAACLDIFMKETGLVQIHKRFDAPKRYTNVIVASADCMQWINNYTESEEVLVPRFLPMVQRPVDWAPGMVRGGGYGADTFEHNLVKARHGSQTELLRSAKMPAVLECSNNLQSTPWAISRELFEVMYDFWERGLDDGGDIPLNRMLELPKRPVGVPRKDPSWTAYNKRAAYVHTTNVRMKAARVALAQTLYTAKKFLGERFYFPVQLDFRGRCYYLPGLLNPQGSDYARALLEFADGEPLTERGYFWFQIFGANLFGNDKVSHAERCEWVEQNRERILASASDPYGCRWWQEAKDKWQFLRWCMAFRKNVSDPEAKCHLPITVDCTSSGLQVLSLLTRDEDSARLSNLTATSRLYDVYTLVKDSFVAHCKADGSDVARLWLQLEPDRSLTKPAVMTIPYGGTTYSIQRNAEEWARPRLAKFDPLAEVKQLWIMTRFYATAVQKIVAELLPKAAECMRWMTAVAKPGAKANQNLTWVSPSGFPVVQPYMKSRSVEVKTCLAGKYRYFKLKDEDPKKVDHERQASSVAPNFIHSLDASIVHLSFSNFKKNGVAIHDCYGAHANHMDELTGIVRMAFVDVFSPNNLQTFSANISESNTNISPASEFILGSFDPCQVIHAPYTFG